MKYKKQLFVTDLDGTLFRENAQISAFSIQSIRKILASDVSFTFATARSLTTVKKILADMPFKLPVICFNGGYIYDYNSAKPLFLEAFDVSIKMALSEIIAAGGYKPFLSTYNGISEQLYFQGLENEGVNYYYQGLLDLKDTRLQQINAFDAKLKEDWMCLLFIERREVLEPLKILIENKFSDFFELNFYENQNTPGWWWLTLHDRSATKDQAIQKLIKLCNLDDYELIVFGDQMNDFRMFQIADRAVAVENSIPELKAIATEVIGCNEDDSVMRYIVKEVGLMEHLE